MSALALLSLLILSMVVLTKLFDAVFTFETLAFLNTLRTLVKVVLQRSAGLGLFALLVDRRCGIFRFILVFLLLLLFGVFGGLFRVVSGGRLFFGVVRGFLFECGKRREIDVAIVGSETDVCVESSDGDIA